MHIGPMKTGSTSIQNVASRKRAELLRNGVYYPGRRLNHRRPAWALMEKKVEVAGDPKGRTISDARRKLPREVWTHFVQDIDKRDSRRVLISDETIAGTSDEYAWQFIDGLGQERTHVVLTIRSPAEVYPAYWMQELKDGHTRSFDQWLQHIFRVNDEKPLSELLKRRFDLGTVVDQWIKVAGAENITVIVVDKKNKSLLSSAFEALLGLPRGTLNTDSLDGARSNRSMSALEAEIIRRVNVYAKNNNIRWSLYRHTIKSGVIQKLLSERTISDRETKVTLPEWAANLAAEEGQRYAERIRESGARIIGNLENLYTNSNYYADSVKSFSQPRSHEITLAVTAICGALDGIRKFESSMHKGVESEPGNQSRFHELASLEMFRDVVDSFPETVRQSHLEKTFTTKELGSAFISRAKKALLRRIASSK